MAVLPTTPQAMGTITADRLRTISEVKLVGAGAGFLALRPTGGGLTSSLLQPTDGVVFEQLQRPVVRQGRLPDPHRSDEVFANPAGQTELGVAVGESFDLIVLPEFSYRNPMTETFEQIDADVSAGKIGQRRRFTLVGVGITSDDIVRPSGTIVFTRAFYDETHSGPAYVGFVVRLKGGRAALPAFEAAVDHLAPGQQVSFQTAAAQEDSVSRTLRPQVDRRTTGDLSGHRSTGRFCREPDGCRRESTDRRHRDRPRGPNRTRLARRHRRVGAGRPERGHRDFHCGRHGRAPKLVTDIVGPACARKWWIADP